MRREEYLHYRKEITKQINKPYMLSNKELAEDLHKAFKEEYAAAALFNINNMQYLCLTEKAKDTFFSMVVKMISDKRQQLEALEAVLNDR